MQTEVIEGKAVYIVESHHEVLEAWGHLRCGMGRAPNLISLDFHTDTHEPFDYYLYETDVTDTQREAERSSLLSAIDYTQMASLRQAVDRLKHDEHILTAIRLDIIAAAFLVCQSPATFTSVFEPEKSARECAIEKLRVPKTAVLRPTEKEMSVFFAEVGCAGDCQKPSCDEECNVVNRRQVIESVALGRYLQELDDKARAVGIPLPREIPYILDIDLDYFCSMSATQPTDSTLFHELIRGAEVITIAIERGCTEYCWANFEPLDIEVLLVRVKKHIKEALRHSES